MKTVAVIVAAGLSSRMGEFKPLLMFDGKATVVFLADKFKEAGVDDIIIVTGHRSDEIVDLFDDSPNIYFVNNDFYATTQMFDSAILGLEKAKNLGADYVLFTPVDVPLLSKKTICLVMQEDQPIVFPRYLARQGHPLKLDINLLDSIINYKGPGGMKGAIESLNQPISFVEVNDAFTFEDMDTPEEYLDLLSKFKEMKEEWNIAFNLVSISICVDLFDFKYRKKVRLK